MQNRHMWSLDALLHLRTFVAVAESLSFSRAAEELMIGQPLLSRRVKALETEIGGELFDRSKRQIALTALGADLLGPARDLLARADRLEAFVRAAQGFDGIRLALPPDSDPRSIARMIAAAAEAGTPLHVEFLAAAEREAAVLEAAVALTVVRVPIDLAGYSVPLGLASATALTDRERPVHLTDLRRSRRDPGPPRRILVTAEDDVPLFREPFSRSAAQSGLVASQVEVMTSTTNAVATVFATDALLLCSRPFARRNGLAWAPLADRSLRRTYRVQASDTQRNNARLEELVTGLAPLIGVVLDAGPVRSDGDDTAASDEGAERGDRGREALAEAWR
ncbi:LysR family transcriptional regulator [Herbiconiux sp. UC225_62]|uniref:LysR family transcriptional regulator n=1 Tax=Herbiconiux sp. UC225_62 TaxID=3350168 RepID=UPI0036D2C797